MFIYPKHNQYLWSSPVYVWNLLNKTQGFIAYIEKTIRAMMPLLVEELLDPTNLSSNLTPMIYLRIS